MLHPLYSQVLLESTSSEDHIVKFKGDWFFFEFSHDLSGMLFIFMWMNGWVNGREKRLDFKTCIFAFILATLLERGRHAAYILLTGPGKEGAEGTVVISKRKVKQDVPESNVLRIGSGGGSETNDDIKEAFNRLRFSDL